METNIKLVNYKTFNGHDGMRGINADIHYNGKKIAHVYDDARGGCFDYTILGYPNQKEVEENKTLFNLMQKQLNFKPHSYELDSFISDLCTALDRKKDEKKGILIKSDFGYDIIGYNESIPTLLKKYKDGLKALQKVYNEQVSLNKTILNKDYLQSQGINI